ncbi:MAG: peptide chain release factor N(5)-glutamine methyltransferase [Acidimicrobiales bacterium]
MSAVTSARAPLSGTAGGLIRATASALGSESEGRWVVAHALGVPSSALDVAAAVSVAQNRAVAAMVERRTAGEPLQYILGEWSFRHLDVDVDGRVLIPRPETEQVVEAALTDLRRAVATGGGEPPAAADLGTGSGVIALSLVLEAAADGVEVWATDASGASLDVAGANVRRLAARHPAAAARVHLARGSWFAALPADLVGCLALVVSNPPYVAESEWSVLDPEVRDHEPRDALVPGPTGFEALDHLLDHARRWLRPGGGLVLELAPHQAAAVAATGIGLGYEDLEIRDDLSGRPRMVVARWPGA